jgi:hypothetical protein
MTTTTVGQLLWLPFSLFARGVNLLVAMAGAVQPCCSGCGVVNELGTAPGMDLAERGNFGNTPPAQGDGATKETKEKKMSNCNCCSDDNGMVKLAEYTIVSIKRCEERILHKSEIVYADDMSDEAFATWVVALYLQEPGVHVPHDDKKFLRVYHHVLQEWPRQKDNCCENREVHVLRGIEEAIRGLTRHVGGGLHEASAPS